MLTNQIFLALFFLYFVLMSGECSEIMNCGLQRYINQNNWIKHFMIFISIYIFTFILNWYTLDSLVVENFNNEIIKSLEHLPYLKKSFYYSIIIYLVLSTKNEGAYLFTFLISSILIVIGTIYTKSINSDIYSRLKNKFIINNKDKEALLKEYEDNEKEVEKIVLLQNIMSVAFIAIFLLLLVGTYKYYLRQSEDHHKNWSWVVFWFGYNKQCKYKK